MNRCVCSLTSGPSRRHFLSALAGGAVLLPWQAEAAIERSRPRIKPNGPGSAYAPSVWAAFVRRREDYGLLWPGQIYDGQAALAMYRAQTQKAARGIGLRLELRPEPIYSREEAAEWVGQAKAAQADGLFLVLLDRQRHAWPTAALAAESSIPSVVYAPIGTAFTTNTAPLAKRDGVVIISTDDFDQAAFGLKMLSTGAKLREMRLLVIQGNERREAHLPFFGTKLRYVPAVSFLEEYERTPPGDEVRRIAADYRRQATRMAGATLEDVQNGVRSYLAACHMLEREQADAVTIDCLGALGGTKVSLPCIGWSAMLDDGVPAGCEADLNAAITHALVQYLFDRPGFQQDPVPDTASECLIGAHCTSPTRLQGFDGPREPFHLSHHHGKRDAVPVPVWRVGQRITVAQVVLPGPKQPRTQLIISTGQVVRNVAVPPAGGCVVSVMVKLDGSPSLLDYPGFHQLFFYGDYGRHLKQYCRLFGIEPLVA